MKRVIKVTVPIDFKIEYDDAGVSLKDLFSALLDSAGAAGWEIQDSLNDLLKDKAAAIACAHVNIDLDKSVAHDYPKLDTDAMYTDYTDLDFDSIEPDEIITIQQ